VTQPPGADVQTGSSAACSASDGTDRPRTGRGVEVDVVGSTGAAEAVVEVVVVDGVVEASDPEQAVSTAAQSTIRRRHVTTTVCRSVSATVTPEAHHDHDVDPICGARRSDDDGGATTRIGAQWFCCEGCRDIFLAARAWPSGTEH